MKRFWTPLTLLLIVSMLVPGMAAAQDEDMTIVVIGKSIHPYWSNVELGVEAAEEALGLGEDQVIFFVPPKEDVAAQ
ncbi:MAG: hypothetical protein JXB47_10940, partial [Anaerolineae bacterium]|nr:hypothetical protein [Anaerolineae bacterium]